MENCLLCKINPADKKGSHVIPHFLLQTMYNQDGKKGRDYEVSMEIGLFSVGNYFGRSVSVEKVNETLGKDLTDEQIAAQTNAFVLDNIFCTQCEKRLSVIESFYAREAIKQTGDINNSCPSLLSTLFWSSVIWRIYSTKLAEMLKDEPFFERIRKVIDSSLSVDEKEMREKCEKNSDEIKKLACLNITAKDLGSPSGSLFIISPINTHPYTTIINENVIFFSDSERKSNYPKTAFFDFEKSIKCSNANPSLENEVIIVIDKKTFRDSIAKVFKFKADLYKIELENHLSYLHLQAFNQPISEALLNCSMHRIIHEEKGQITVAQRYDMKRVIRIFLEEVQKRVKFG